MKKEAEAAEILTYDLAYLELRSIAEEIENENVPIDQLAEKVKRASFLIEYCQTKLRATEKEVNNIIGQMEKNLGDTKEL